MAAAQPVTTRRECPFARRARRTALRVFFSASPVTVQVLTTTTSALAVSVACMPAARSCAAAASDSTRFTLQPKLTTAKFMRISVRSRRPAPLPRARAHA